MKHLLGVDDLDVTTATEILDDAQRFEQALLGREVRKLRCGGRTVMTVFYEELHPHPGLVRGRRQVDERRRHQRQRRSSSAGKGESLRDTAPKTLHAAGADALIVRHPASGAAHQIARWTSEDGPGRR